ncbi:MAG: VOC family protein [Candidatus Thorarchaeota archaeon]
MKRVLGIGGVFIKVENPEEIQKWYEENLGIESDAEGYIIFQWKDLGKRTGKAYTLWGLFPQDTKYFEPSESQFMINFLVQDLDGLLKELRKKGVKVDNKIEEHQEGRFAWFVDPWGNKVELWEPPK